MFFLSFLKEDFIRKSTKTTLLTKYIHICTSHHQLHLQTLHILQHEVLTMDIQLVDRLTKQMDLGNVLTNIYIDLSKAFDTLDHSILLDKLNYYGICGVENLMLRTYLSNRHEYVENNDSKSETKSISIGVPQGSILGPLLFLIYINDLPRVSRVFSMLMYADDTTLYCNINNANSDIILYNELCKISDWLSSNKLSFNVKKTKYMVFHTPQKKVIYPIIIAFAFPHFIFH